MNEQIKIDFEKTFKTSGLSETDINLKKKFLDKFILNGFPNKKLDNWNAVNAIDKNIFAGFCYIEVLGHGKYVAHSGLIVSPNYRKQGLAKKIKKKVFELSLKKYPNSKVFGITTGMAVMKIKYELGYKPVHFSELTDDPEFWKGCQTCKNYDVLTRTNRTMCLCTGMLYDPKNKKYEK